VCLLSGTFCPHSVFMCFVWIWEQTAIISLYSIKWLVFITETECVYCVVRSAHTVYLCVLCGSENKQRLFYCAVRSAHSVFMCFVWIWEQTAIISLHSINRLVFMVKQSLVWACFTIKVKVLWSFETSITVYPVPCSLKNCISCSPIYIELCATFYWDSCFGVA
jgi:hypothetical protein